ncbi:uncharacterized protein B0I36DRAFT_392147 [Microdochium trichocladiopsis]|uniref:Uncharacterized protein n=1 Tax=Microdochium trichocladiopsis TaxID=1682393 RepID=A0A9P9BWX9_9PEZI|nr:uncharacterized protein B0I36DRAFT_392147 [Microdochium trichocladiopsis]KAH7041247.1 hypothetical protein B0I36DRAFT_392147 [Microdochium trichocladiopsis]
MRSESRLEAVDVHHRLDSIQQVDWYPGCSFRVSISASHVTRQDAQECSQCLLLRIFVDLTAQQHRSCARRASPAVPGPGSSDSRNPFLGTALHARKLKQAPGHGIAMATMSRVIVPDAPASPHYATLTSQPSGASPSASPPSTPTSREAGRGVLLNLGQVCFTLPCPEVLEVGCLALHVAEFPPSWNMPNCHTPYWPGKPSSCVRRLIFAARYPDPDQGAFLDDASPGQAYWEADGRCDVVFRLVSGA